MSKAQVNKNGTKVTTKTTTTTIVTDKWSLWLVIITGITLLLVIIIGICVKFLLDTYISSIILISLICFEIVFGLLVLSLLASRKKKYKTDQTVVAVRRNGEYHIVNPTIPTAPVEETSWDYTNRETIPA